MKLVLLVMQLRLYDLELKTIASLNKNLVGEPEKDREYFIDIAGRAAGKAWREGLECCLTLRGKPYKYHLMPDRIIGNIDGRLSNTFREAGEILAIREKRRHGEKDHVKFLAEYTKTLSLGMRAAIHDAAGAAMVYGKGL